MEKIANNNLKNDAKKTSSISNTNDISSYTYVKDKNCNKFEKN